LGEKVWVTTKESCGENRQKNFQFKEIFFYQKMTDRIFFGADIWIFIGGITLNQNPTQKQYLR